MKASTLVLIIGFAINTVIAMVLVETSPVFLQPIIVIFAWIIDALLLFFCRVLPRRKKPQ
jgi:hypothetical protein